MKKIRLGFVVAVIVLILFAVFVLQNAQPTIVQFIGGQFEASLALILFLAFAIGVVSGVILAVPLMFRRNAADSQRQVK